MDSINTNDIVQKIIGAIQNEFAEMKKLNVMILGKTGVGKSTLINNMFNQQLAETGVGKPITSQIRKIEKMDFPLAIYDTPGLELGGEFAVENLLAGVTSEIKKGVKTGDISKAIHCIWYCVSTPSHRFEQTEVEFLRKFLGEIDYCNVPVIIVLTQAFSKKDAKTLMAEIEKEQLPVAGIVPVLAENYAVDEDYIVKAYGLEQLSELMNEVIPETVQNTFISVQKANIALKKRRAQAIVTTSAIAAATTSAVPIPCADSILLVPEQIAMLAAITASFGIPMEKATLMTIISGTIGTTGTTVVGKTFVSGILKLIPGVGSVVGGVISSTTAAALTTALGEAYISVLVKICSGNVSIFDLKSERGKEIVSAIFKEQLMKPRGKDGKLLASADAIAVATATAAAVPATTAETTSETTSEATSETTSETIEATSETTEGSDQPSAES